MLSCCNSSFPLSPNPLGSSSSVVFSCPRGMTHAMGPLRRKNCSAQDKSNSSVSYPGPRASPAPHSALLPLDEQTQNSNQAWTIRRHISNLKTNAVHTYLFSLVLNTLKWKLSDWYFGDINQIYNKSCSTYAVLAAPNPKHWQGNVSSHKQKNPQTLIFVRESHFRSQRIKITLCVRFRI